MIRACGMSSQAGVGAMHIFRAAITGFLVLSLAEIAFAAREFPFQGDIDFVQKKFNIVLGVDSQSSVAVSARQVAGSEYKLLLDVNHLQTPLFDLMTKVESTIEVKQGHNETFSEPLERLRLQGKVWSQYSLIDYKPVRELSGNFEVKDNKLFLHSLFFGNLQCNGTVDLISPYRIDLTFNLYDVAMQDFLSFWGMGKKYESAGLVSGEIKAAGTVDQLDLKGNLEGRNGFVQKLDFDALSLNIEGIYPDMKITRSMIAKSDGMSFTFEGSLNLKDKENFKKQIKALTLAPLVSDSGIEREWTIRRLNPDAAETTELKYRLRKEDALGTGASADGGIDMLGIEQTRKF
ncbi:MAG: hypothetical protein A3C36_03640 [Omnitrophica WOR_2 bacterium RIFCSPHIGHO2_02_FULL_52_10]|nr:MAG: hypothetical protein A3C36_03640 [Omnitrophica WOR_2 bacterium RIFCSPHIGHO2_02_FULL_52_10]